MNTNPTNAGLHESVSDGDAGAAGTHEEGPLAGRRESLGPQAGKAPLAANPYRMTKPTPDRTTAPT